MLVFIRTFATCDLFRSRFRRNAPSVWQPIPFRADLDGHARLLGPGPLTLAHALPRFSVSVAHATPLVSRELHTTFVLLGVGGKRLDFGLDRFFLRVEHSEALPRLCEIGRFGRRTLVRKRLFRRRGRQPLSTRV